MHARRAIVNAAATVLAGLVTTGPRVHPGRADAVNPDEMPCLLVYARQEQSESLTTGSANRKLGRMLTLSIEALVSDTSGTDAALDVIAVEVETALAGDPTLGGACKDLVLVASNIAVSPDGETRVRRIRLDFSVLYHTVASAPQTAT